ncbi:MAG TPA: PadR family transcriptional regulator [Solirubrobacterales bacterium]|jgi:DNA-binding PadR family transcriptional regulator|nr:PadR family transcriptional regulator [Solirubrobacterales bacterium]
MKSKSIRLTGNSYAVLALLDQCGGEATSYELKQALEVSVENFWPVPHTTAYEEPARLAAGGYLTARQEAGGRRKRVYALTDAGRAALTAWAADPAVAPPQLREEAVLKIFAGAEPGPLLDSRVAWHQGKQAELEGYLEGVRGIEGMERSERTLLVGITYHEKMLELLELMAEPGAVGSGASARG